MREIIGNTTATPNPRSDWNQTDETKADYIKNKPEVLTEDEIVKLIKENGGGVGVQSDWQQIDESQLDFIKNKPDVYLKSEANEIFALASDMIELQAAINGVEEELRLINEGGVE